MLIYRSAARQIDTRGTLASMGERLCAGGESLSHEHWVALLIEAGELESALSDAECAGSDRETRVTRALRTLSVALADGMVRAWEGGTALPDDLEAARRAWSAARDLGTGGSIRAGVPEGFAYYGLYPETYIAATRDFAATSAPARVLVIGIRSIGTTLSAVVSATLGACGVANQSITLRPRGHPFDRELALAPELERRLRAAASCPEYWFAIVDEGPGLSGSSFASVADVLRAAGAPAERVVLFPSWDPDAQALGSARGRDCWRRHRKFTGDFDALWVLNNRLAAPFGARIRSDLSGGAWRQLMSGHTEIPATQPQHEARKYQCEAEGRPGRLLLKFEGLGHLGLPRLTRARALAGAGFGPRPEGFANGFLATRWVDGVPLTERDVTPAFVEHVASYVSWLHQHARAKADVSADALLAMLRFNVREALGDESATQVEALSPLVERVARVPAVRVDGRMMPHEWLRSSGGFVKTDCLSHHDDHFYPGAQDAAWDLAGATVELRLAPNAERVLVQRYAAETGDHAVSERLTFWRPAYLAFRLGYTTMAAGALGSAPDASRMRALAADYRERLARELRATAAAAPFTAS